MKKRELANLGLARDAIPAAVAVCTTHRPKREAARAAVATIIDDPESMKDDPVWGAVAQGVMGSPTRPLRDEPAPLQIWGRVGEDIDQQSVDQARRACELPIWVAWTLSLGSRMSSMSVSVVIRSVCMPGSRQSMSGLKGLCLVSP